VTGRVPFVVEVGPIGVLVNNAGIQHREPLLSF